MFFSSALFGDVFDIHVYLMQLLQGSEWSIATIQQYLITPYTVGDADSIKWRLNHQTDRFHLPPGFDMLLGDVSGLSLSHTAQFV
jgi:hypothetical protein